MTEHRTSKEWLKAVRNRGLREGEGHWITSDELRMIERWLAQPPKEGLDFLLEWMTTPNPSFGNSSPLDLMWRDRGHKVAKFIDEAIEDRDAVTKDARHEALRQMVAENQAMGLYDDPKPAVETSECRYTLDGARVDTDCSDRFWLQDGEEPPEFCVRCGKRLTVSENDG